MFKLNTDLTCTWLTYEEIFSQIMNKSVKLGLNFYKSKVLILLVGLYPELLDA